MRKKDLRGRRSRNVLCVDLTDDGVRLLKECSEALAPRAREWGAVELLPLTRSKVLRVGLEVLRNALRGDRAPLNTIIMLKKRR